MEKIIRSSKKYVKARTGYQKGHGRVIKDTEKLKEFVEANYDKTTRELARN
ncbi:MAG: hypothetical protein MTP17_02020 [Candidatus Midichloria sp.]|nr:MAG: hypothetical protein MTP17_02020 [Candidatus Midichloria sp.]